MIPDGEFSPSQYRHEIVTSASIILVRVRIDNEGEVREADRDFHETSRVAYIMNPRKPRVTHCDFV